MPKVANDLKSLIEELLLLLVETESFHRRADVQDTLKQARSILLNLHVG